MSHNPRPTGSFASAHTAGEQYRVVIVGAGTLKGKELAEALPESVLPIADLKLLDDNESLGQLESVGDEVTFVQSVSRDNFDNADFAFFASRPEFTRRNWTLARDARVIVLDLSYALEDEPGARIRSSWIERELGQTPAPELEPGPVIVAHPAAVVLALLLLRIRRLTDIRSAVATIFEPASEHGRVGMDELHEQTVNLLSLQEIPKKIFDVQVAFNLVARFGGKSTAAALDQTEHRILGHFHQITPGTLIASSIRVVQAPIFHGYSVSIYVELEESRSTGDFVQALSGEHVNVTRAAEEMPSNVSVAGQAEVLVSVKNDMERPVGFWIWAAADNLRLQALTAVECAARLSITRPKGKVQ